MHRILSKEILAPDVVRFWLDAPVVARKRRPGQFVIIRLSEDGERIPLTIADADASRGAISLIIQGVGKSTDRRRRQPVEFPLAWMRLLEERQRLNRQRAWELR